MKLSPEPVQELGSWIWYITVLVQELVRETGKGDPRRKTFSREYNLKYTFSLYKKYL